MNISIIIPCYNKVESLPLTLESLNRGFMSEKIEGINFFKETISRYIIERKLYRVSKCIQT